MTITTPDAPLKLLLPLLSQGTNEEILDRIFDLAVKRFAIPEEPTWFPLEYFEYEVFAFFEGRFDLAEQYAFRVRVLSAICPYHVMTIRPAEQGEEGYLAINEWFLETGRGFISGWCGDYDPRDDSCQVIHCFSDPDTAFFYKLKFG